MIYYIKIILIIASIFGLISLVIMAELKLPFGLVWYLVAGGITLICALIGLTGIGEKDKEEREW